MSKHAITNILYATMHIKICLDITNFMIYGTSTICLEIAYNMNLNTKNMLHACQRYAYCLSKICA